MLTCMYMLVKDIKKCDEEWFTLVVAITIHYTQGCIELQPQDMGENEKSVIHLERREDYAML